MEIHTFIKGAILGFSIAAPVGPIGILCIRRTVQFGRFSGFFTGLGAALADTIYGIIAAFGFTLVSDFLLAGQSWFRFVGGCFLIFLGVKTFFAKTMEISQTGITHKTLLSDFISTFFLTLSNPMTIFAFIAVFAGLGLVDVSEDYANVLWLIGGIFIGSALWWMILSEGITYFRKKVSIEVMTWINRCAGMLIIAFGLFAWASILSAL